MYARQIVTNIFINDITILLRLLSQRPSFHQQSYFTYTRRKQRQVLRYHHPVFVNITATLRIMTFINRPLLKIDKTILSDGVIKTEQL